ncbi:MAG: outer membrane protein transport protein [Bacteroidales bacterium]|nr:outer membrane protein transport protein [Bacteroidales bacterium]
MKKLTIISMLMALPFAITAQTAMDAYSISSSQIKGTARYISMGGAFTSLGGDPSSIAQNPAGIGVYRSSEVSASMGGQWTSNSSPFAETAKKGTFTFDNMSLVTTFFTGKSSGLINFNLGVTYNRNQSYKRKYNAATPELGASFTNYLEMVTNGIPSTDLVVTKDRDSYYETSSPWLSILGYQSYLISPTYDGASTYYGLYTPGKTTGSSYTTILEDGRNDEYNINFGGNINDRIYFGLALGIRDVSISREIYYTEDLHNTDGVFVDNGIERNITSSNFQKYTFYNMRGVGFNGKIGIIARLTDNLRLGATIHTPTFFTIDQTMDAAIDNQIVAEGVMNVIDEYQVTPAVATNTIKIRTPWNFQVGASYIAGGKAIISADYQYTAYNNMQMNEYDGEQFPIENAFYKACFKPGHTVKVGAEFRATNALSLRAGYALQLSPIKAELKDVNVEVPTAGMQTTYMLPGNGSYYSCGAGYKFSKCYLDFAYQHFAQKSDMFSFSPIFASDGSLIPASSEIKTKQNAITFTFGLKF